MTDIAVHNYLRKKVVRKKISGSVDLQDFEDPNAAPIPSKLPKSIEKNMTFDTLGNNDALLERNKSKNFDGKKIRGL